MPVSDDSNKFRDPRPEQFAVGCCQFELAYIQIPRGDGLLKGEACGCWFFVKM